MSRSGIVFVFNLNLRVFNLNLCVKSVFSWRCFTGRRTAQDNRNRARHWATLRALLWRDDPEHGPGTIVRRAAASDQQARHGTAMGARFLARLNNKQHLHELSADCCPLLERRHGYSAARTRWFPTWSQASVYTFSRASNWSRHAIDVRWCEAGSPGTQTFPAASVGDAASCGRARAFRAWLHCVLGENIHLTSRPG